MLKRILERLLEVTASVRLAVSVLVLVIAASIFGTTTQYDVYHSWWFLCLIGLFGINLLSCTLLGVARGRTRAGSFVTHLGILVVLSGVITGSALGARGQVSLIEGQVTDRFTTGNTRGRLPFQIRLDEFRIDWGPEAPHELQVAVFDAGIRKSMVVEVGKTYILDETGYSIEVSRFVPDLLVDRERGIVSRSDNPSNPAMQLLIRRAESLEKRWVFARHPEFSMARDSNIEIVYSHNRSPAGYTSRLTLVDTDGSTTPAVTSVNHPVKHRGWSIYQARFDLDQPGWTGLDMVYDPGVGIVFAGIALMNAGVFLVLYRRFRKSTMQ